MQKTRLPSEIPVHDGSVLAGAIHLKLTDMMIRRHMHDLMASERFHEITDKLPVVGGPEALHDLIYSDAPIPHPLRVMLCAIFDMECPQGDKV